MSELYNVIVEDVIDEKTCILEIKVIHPDSMKIPVTPGFALMLLQDDSDGEPLSSIVDLGTVMDEEWIQHNARGFIDNVELLSLKNEMPEEADNNYDHEFWNNPSLWPEARLRIQVTHPAWISHIKPGHSWETASFDPARFYDPCVAISPDEKMEEITLEKDFKTSIGFMPIPKIMLFSEQYPQDFFEVVYMPSYNLPSYESYELLEDDELNDFNFDEWIGKPVLWSYYGSSYVGVLVSVEGETLRLKANIFMESNVELIDIDWISLAAFKNGKNRQRQALSISETMKYASAAIMSSKIKEDILNLSITVFDPYIEDLELSKSAALDILSTPLKGYFDELDEGHPLGAALKYEMKKKGIESLDELYPLIAKGYVKKIKITPPKDVMEDLDSLSRNDLLEFYKKNKWPVYNVEIKLSDSNWAKHLKKTIPHPCRIKYYEDDSSKVESRKWEKIKKDLKKVARK